MIENILNKFLCQKLNQAGPVEDTENSNRFFFILPYFGHKSVLFSIALQNLISENFPNIKPRPILINSFKLSVFFNFKDAIPKEIRSSVVYKYSCAQTNCASVYVGSTTRALRTRVCEHRGISSRTGHPLLNPPHSAARDHADQCASDLSLNSFQILCSQKSNSDLRILESLYIHRLKPNLNDMASAFPLKIVNR